MSNKLTKSQQLGNHMIFSMDNPMHGTHNPDDHKNMVNKLKSMGANVNEAQGKYGAVERSIIVHNPNDHIKNVITDAAQKQGQDSLIHSDGTNHKMVFLNGPNAGMHHKGSGTEHHQQEPKDFYTKMDNGTVFSHNFNFDGLHKSMVASPSKHMNLKQMLNIKRDNNVGANGKDYSSEELNDGIVRAKTNLAAKMKLFPKHSEGNTSFPPHMPMKKADKPKWDSGNAVAETIAALKMHKERHAQMLAQKQAQPTQAPMQTVQTPIATPKPSNTSQLENIQAPTYVNIHQHRSAVRNYIPNPVSNIQHLDDVKKLNQYHGKDIVESIHNEPKPQWGHETYRVNPDKTMHLMSTKYDSSN